MDRTYSRSEKAFLTTGVRSRWTDLIFSARWRATPARDFA